MTDIDLNALAREHGLGPLHPRASGRHAPPEQTWTVPLLTSHLRSHGITISARTLRRRIREARFRWKRPRYVYHERADHVGAKKGGSFDA